MSTPPQPTVRLTWIGRCVYRLKRLYGNGTPIPNGDRGLTYAEYIKLVQCILGEHTEAT